jgi:hypothetical protein
MRWAGAEACGQIYRHGLGNESGAGVEVENAPPIRCRVSGLFEEFALGGVQIIFTGIDAAGWEFP